MKIILASTSRYRKELLSRFGIPFGVAAPDVDESPLEGELPEALAVRLARIDSADRLGFPFSLLKFVAGRAASPPYLPWEARHGWLCE